MALKDSVLFSKKVLINLGIILIAGIFGLFLIFWWLGFYTNHGEAFSVPDFEGLVLRQAIEKAKSKDLHINVIDSVFSAPGRPGTVIDQNPPKDFKVKSGRTVFITIKSRQAKMIKMPDLTDITLIQAKADLRTYGLRIGDISYRPSKYDNVVLEQLYKGETIEAETPVAKGSAIDLILGEKENMGKTTTPSLLGLTQTDAEFKAAEAWLNLGVIVYDETVKTYMDSLNATVVKQVPVKNAPLNPGDEIDIELSMEPDTSWVNDGEIPEDGE